MNSPLPPQPPASAHVLQAIAAAKQGRTVRSVPIHDDAGRVVGRAEALGVPHVARHELVPRFVRWRNQNRLGWLDQRPVTVASTEAWFERYFAAPRTLLYLFFAGDTLVGRTGMLELGADYYLTDGLVRGERGGGMSFITWANASLVRADLDFTRVRFLYSKVISDNELAMLSSDRLGYTTIATRPLYRDESAAGLQLTEDGGGQRPLDGRTVIYRRASREAILAALPREGLTS